MRVLAIEPFYGGSHKAFLDGWIERSRHDWTVLGLPPCKWKWRMRHAPITFADDVAEYFAITVSFVESDVCSDAIAVREPKCGAFRLAVPTDIDADQVSDMDV